MAATVDELTMDYEEDGVLVIKEIDKAILTKGAWATVIHRYQQWNKETNDYGPDRYAIRRYRKLNGDYKLQSKFSISSQDQAKKIIEILSNWVNNPNISD
ncbi:hypothetical protein [Desulfovibrio litoralis]|uniref:Transcriptional coactivator p15 (PC4) C-terminal domain-containing protein n=1 Tax=Desulfovibrio litoralis DSM 11393 TaxID=1121455 RepID=A0A1M7SP53_9BACT|nr:hypothetical protein [Desulfovibrio litoralis]SHN60293.1 hypothetical protein SAMN02745728_01112 [Desulfovibrio litoralis DSM 11393]